MKADELVIYEIEEGKTETMKFTNFELLQKEVDVLKDIVTRQSSILRQNGLSEKVEAPVYDSEIAIGQLL